jgi:hypothetical protein
VHADEKLTAFLELGGGSRLWRIGLTGWEIFSNLDAVKWTLNQAEDIS